MSFEQKDEKGLNEIIVELRVIHEKKWVVNAENISTGVTATTRAVDVCIIEKGSLDAQYTFRLDTLASNRVVTRSRKTARRISSTVRNVKEVYWIIETDKIPLKIRWPEPLANRLVRYLQDGGPIHLNFDCGCFGEYMLGYTFSNPITRWSMVITPPLREDSLEAGDVVGIHYLDSEAKRKVTHIMVAIGGRSGLFISKFGSGGGLIVSDIESCKTLFGGTCSSLAVRDFV